ncbi:MAG TPA: sigma-70 family RNA polymerase sigma factor, partial [Polyangiaceae bacterium]
KTAKLVRAHYEEAEDARKELIRANMRLVIWIAKRKRDHGLALGDLVQEGNIGLMRAADKFDHRRGVRFSTYATWWIRQSVNRALSDQSRTIRLPVHLLEVKHKLEGARRRFTAHHGREPTAEELATATSIAMPRIRQVLDAPKQPLSMETPVGSEGDSTLGDVVSDQDLVSPIDHIVDQRLRATIGKLLTKLSPREQLVLKMRFGIDQSDGTTLQEVGNKLSVSRERIRQIESEALHKLRDQAEPEGLSSYLSA